MVMGEICIGCGKVTTRPKDGRCYECAGQVEVSIPCPSCGVHRPVKQKTTWNKGFDPDQNCHKCQHKSMMQERGTKTDPLELPDIPKKKFVWSKPVKERFQVVRKDSRVPPALSDPYQFARKRASADGHIYGHVGSVVPDIEDHVFGFGRSCGG